jgi:hypothetical protein
MTTARRLSLCLAAALAGAAPAPADEAVTLAVVKLPELRKAIEAHQGKVVVLDMWAEY